MCKLNAIVERIAGGGTITREEAQAAATAPLPSLRQAATAVREHFFGLRVELCAIINARNGRCREDCHFCAQSRHFPTTLTPTRLITTEAALEQAAPDGEAGVHRLALVTSGRSLNAREVSRLATTYAALHARYPDLGLCASHGLLDAAALKVLKAAGVTRIHCNLETSRRFFPQICTTHGYADKLQVLQTAAAHGFELCSGMIIGMGETLADRLDLGFELAALGVASAPINILNPIPGTPLEHQMPLSFDEIARTMALLRLVAPHTVLRLAGGRILIRDRWTELLDYGVNAIITGHMLTTCGLSVEQDRQSLFARQREVCPIPFVLES